MNDIRDLFRQNRFEQIEAALNRNDVSAVRRLAMAVRGEYVGAHDGFRDAVAKTLAYIAGTRGPEIGERVGRECIEELQPAGDPPQYAQADLRQRVKAIAAGWHWHATRFSLTEDQEKFTFLLHPCGSGMRLIQEGYYTEGPWGPPLAGKDDAQLTRSRGSSWSTFMNDGFPIYCNHCSEMNHLALARKSATFLVEGWTPARARGLCIQYTFKDITFVPDDFYRRADLPLPVRGQPSTYRQVFSESELIDIQTHPLDKLVDRAESNDLVGARAALDECLLGWRDSIHDVYRRWLSMLWVQVYKTLGDSAFGDVVRATAPDLLAHVRATDLLGWAAFWSIHLRLHSIETNQSGLEFLVGCDSLLQPGILPHEAAWFAQRLNEGLADRHWSDVGQFRAVDQSLLHSGLKQ